MSEYDFSHHTLNAHGILAVVVFICVSVVCIHPFSIPLPFLVSKQLVKAKCYLVGQPSDVSNSYAQRWYLVLNHIWTPSLAISLLLMTKTIGVAQLRVGCLGGDGIEPYDILLFFISLAYISISLDRTGLLKYLALQVCLKAGNSGMRLFLLLYLFWWSLGLLAGNDPVILSGTAFLVYLTGAAGIVPPNAWLWAQFVAANIASAILVTSNPTNLVIASGLEIEFTTYTAYMILPSIVSANTALGTILLLFRSSHHAQIVAGFRGRSRDIGEGTARAASTARKRAETPEPMGDDSGIAMQEVTSTNRAKEETVDWSKPPIVYIPKVIVHASQHSDITLEDAQGAIFVSILMIATLFTVIATNVSGKGKTYMSATVGAAIALLRDLVYDYYTWIWLRRDHEPVSSEEEGQETVSTAEGVILPSDRKPLLKSIVQRFRRAQVIFPTVTHILQRLPFTLLPFAVGMFTLVESLNHVGFIDIMADGFGKVCARGYIGCSFFHSLLGVLMCNLGGTNIGATILLTRSLQSTAFQQQLPLEEKEVIMRAAAFSVAFGSNVGAMGGTFGASLAGLLWRDDLRARGVIVSKAQFAFWCAVVIVPATLSGILVLVPEVRYSGLRLSAKSHEE